MNMSSRIVIALGIAGCIITAGCDLSAGRMIGFGGCIAGTLLQKMDYSQKFFPDMEPMNIFVALLIVMVICAVFGCVTGFFIAYMHVPPFISTMAMMEVVYGINLIYTNATPLGGYTKQYTDIATGKFLGINYLIWIATSRSGSHMVYFQHDPSWKIHVCNRWQPAGSGSSRCSGKEDLNYHLRKGSGNVWPGRLYARCKSPAELLYNLGLWIRDGGDRSLHNRWCIRIRWTRKGILCNHRCSSL